MRHDPQDNLRKLYAIADRQGGYFTAAQALQAGYAYSQQHFHRNRGTWLQIERGIYRLRDFPTAEREDLICLALWSRNQKGEVQAVASHETALAIYELSDVMPANVHLTVPRGFRKPAPPGCILHKASLTDDEIEQRVGFQVTRPLRTLIDAAESPLSQEHVDKAVLDALENGLILQSNLEKAICSSKARQRLDIALEVAQKQFWWMA